MVLKETNQRLKVYTIQTIGSEASGHPRVEPTLPLVPSWLSAIYANVNLGLRLDEDPGPLIPAEPSVNSVPIESIDVIRSKACRVPPFYVDPLSALVFFPATLGTLPGCPASRDFYFASSASSARTLHRRSPASLANCRPDFPGLVVSPMDGLALLRPNLSTRNLGVEPQGIPPLRDLEESNAPRPAR